MGQFILYLENDNPGEEQLEVSIKLPAKVEEYIEGKRLKRVEVNKQRFVPASLEA
jgi:hypothetical protein